MNGQNVDGTFFSLSREDAAKKLIETKTQSCQDERRINFLCASTMIKEVFIERRRNKRD